MTRASAVLVVLALACGCSSDKTNAPVPAVDHDAEGSWGENFHSAVTPGDSFLMSLTESSGVIAGTGSFAGEAGPFGSLVVSGTVANDSLHLRIVYVLDPHTFPGIAPDTAQFVGVLTNRDQIDGSMTQNGTTFPFGLIRLQINDPP